MRKIIYVWNYREWGGAQIYYLSLMKAAKPAYSISAVIPSDSDPKILQYLDTLGIRVEFTEPAMQTVSPAGFFGKLSHRFRVFRSESRLVDRILSSDDLANAIVHIDLGFWLSFRALSSLCRRTNVFVTQHTALADPGGIRALLWRIKGKLISRSPNFHVLASNYDAKNSLKPFLAASKFNDIRVTYSGLEPDEFTFVSNKAITKSAIGARYALAPDRPLLMTVGQFIDRKGCWVLLESLKRLRVNGEQFQFVWLGTSPPDTITHDRIISYGLGDAFRLMDGVEIGPTRHELLSLLSVADMFVLASLAEGLPIALVEAMALGLPCIATEVGAINEAIDNGASGLLVQAGDAQKLAEAIRRLLHDPESRKTFGTAARVVAFEKFNQQKTAEKTVRIYDNVVENKRLDV